MGAFLKEVDGGTEPSREELEACDGWLKVHAPGAYAQARELADEQRDGLFRVTRGLYEAYGANDVFIAAAAVPGDGTNPDDAYRSCLVALLERILGLLEEPGAPRSIRFRVATRHTNEPRLGRSIPLNAKHIVEAARLARESVQVGTAGGDAAARLVPLELVTTFDRHVKAGVVLADILANQLRFPLGLDRSWESLVADIAPRVKLFPQTNARRWSGVVLPAVAHDARARQWLEEAGPADPAERPRLGRTSPRWAGEQARAWAAVVGKR
ncbi:MAG: hypothetical protein JJ863_38525 [Deltaproteobacteria bacterium]|nr:hypothetical protein [Deltaproteobacteria bacterium]